MVPGGLGRAVCNLGGPEGDGRVELPHVELPFDVCPVTPGGRQAICQALRPPAHLLWLGQALLDQPSSMTRLQGIGQSGEVPQR